MAEKWAGVSGSVAWDWVVRLWGSWTSWMYANNANLLTEGRWPGGSWMWDTFYKNDPAAKGRQGGWHWGAPTANDAAVVEALQYMVNLKNQKLSSSPDVGGGGTLQGLFASNHIGMTIGGGFWAGGLHTAGMSPSQFDVQYFPAWFNAEAPARRRRLRDAEVVAEQGTRLGVHEVADRAGRARRADRWQYQHADPPLDDDGEPVRPDRPSPLAGVLRDTGQVPEHHADSRAPVLPVAGHGLRFTHHPGHVERECEIGAGWSPVRPGRLRVWFSDLRGWPMPITVMPTGKQQPSIPGGPQQWL